MNVSPTYHIPEPLLQAIVNMLNSLPAGQVRGLLNEVENECRRQDAERAEAEQAALRAQILAEAQGALE